MPAPRAQVLGDGQREHAALVAPRRGGRLRVAEGYVQATVVVPSHHKLIPAAYKGTHALMSGRFLLKRSRGGLQMVPFPTKSAARHLAC